MFKVLTRSGIHQTTSETTARTIAVNAAIAGEVAVLVTATCEYLVRKESRGAVMAYSVSDAQNKSSELMEVYREVCFQAYAAEEKKSKDAANKAVSASKSARYEDLGPTWMEETFNHFFGDLMSLAKK